jgi:hypothetical protein
MPLSGLIATTEHVSEARYRERRAPPDRPNKPQALPAIAPFAADEAEDGYDADYYGRRFKTDLSQLKVFDGTEEAPPPPDAGEDSALFDFFGHLSVLLVAVRAGDIARAQSAADALELDALVDRNIARRSGGSAAMLGDLVALLGAAQSRDETAARVAAKDLADDLQSVVALPAYALRDPHAVAAEDAGAAYDTLTQYLDGGSGSL